jgi:NMD protein affecting ribosome stability and mRNA decay
MPNANGITIPPLSIFHYLYKPCKPSLSMIIKLCPTKKYFWKNKWKDFDDVDTLFTELFGKTPLELGIKDLELNSGTKRKFKIEKNGKMQDVDLEVTLCPKAAKSKSTYFEGILQVKNATQEVIDFIYNDVRKLASKGIFITKDVLTKDRADFFITDQTYIKTLANKLQSQFGGTVSLNAKLFSQDQHAGKDLFRLTVLLDLPIYKKQDIIIVNDKPYIIKSLQNKINVVDFNGKNTNVPYSKYVLLEKKETRISKVYPYIEILDPDTFQAVEVQNPKDLKLSIDQKVKVVFYKGWWVV